jgi:GTPase SAR1 family protein
MEQPDFKPLAEETLDAFLKISTKAGQELQFSSNVSVSNSFASTNSFTGGKALQNLQSINKSNREALSTLKTEPAIARVVAEDSEGNQKTVYISRKASLTFDGGGLLTNYDMPLGRLAALPVGEEGKVSINGKDEYYYIVEKIIFHPKTVDGSWDSFENNYRHESWGTFTLESLRSLLSTFDLDADELDKLLEEAEVASGIIKGVTHQIRTAMSLRDQPILDEFQDEIFRLPLNSQLIILGPPGTGKTTTLIKRLGQKLDYDILEESEKHLIKNSENELPHNTSWLMFTPSELLKHYLKEAFSREQVPTSDERIKTWSSYRHDIARNSLGILKTPNGGKYTHKATLNIISTQNTESIYDWFTHLRRFHISRIIQQLADGVKIVGVSTSEQHQSLVEKLSKLMERASHENPIQLFRDLDELENEIKLALEVIKNETEELVKKERNRIYNKNKAIFSELARFIDTLELDDEEGDEDAEFDDDIEENDNPTQSGIQKAVKAYLAFLRTYARHQYHKKSTSKKSRTGRIKDWLGDRLPPKDAMIDIGRKISFQNGLRRFSNTTRRYVSDIPQSYRMFRKNSIGKTTFYSQEFFESYQLDSTEMDAIILLMLKNVRELLGQSFVTRNLDAPRFSHLKNVSTLFRNQIMVDEATDFSILQLACMHSLSSLNTHSFFACGDFNQRITSYGVQSLAQVKWMLPMLGDRKITIIYRQSRQLNQFAEMLLRLSGGDIDALGILPKESIHEGVQPTLIENIPNLRDAAKWIAARITEVESTVKQMPTIAVLVNNESEVKAMANELTSRIEAINLKAVPCEEGKALGEGTDVRVFDVQHIKGLEFEAVFFVGLDQLAKEKPELSERYLYVGSTRAATYLGMVCYDDLPEKLAPLREQCVKKW